MKGILVDSSGLLLDLRLHTQLHFPNLFYTPLELVDTGWRAGGDEIAGAKGDDAGEKSYMISETANHILGVRCHSRLAVQLHFDG